MSARPDTWMPFYVGDYLRDTGHLTVAEHGAYFLLLLNAWTRDGSLPDDDLRLRMMAKMDVKEWKASGKTIREFFYSADGCLRHKRMDRELANAKAHSTAKAEAGRRGAEKRWHNDAKTIVGSSQDDGTAIAQPSNSHRQTDTPSPSPSPNTSSLRSDDTPSAKRAKARSQIKPDWQPDDAGIAYATDRGVNVSLELPAFRNHHIAKGSLMADWPHAWRTWCDNQVKWGKAPGRTNADKPPSTIAGITELPAAFDPPDAWGVRNWVLRQPDITVEKNKKGEDIYVLNGYGVEEIALNVLSDARIPVACEPKLDALGAWLRADVDIGRARAVIRRIAARDSYTPVGALSFFDSALRSERVLA